MKKNTSKVGSYDLIPKFSLYQLSHIFDEFLVMPGQNPEGKTRSGNSNITSNGSVSSCPRLSLV